MSNLDEAFERFLRVDLEYAGGFANHGPMGAEALQALGHPALIPAFVDRYAPRVPPARTGRVLAPAEQSVARGDPTRAFDWVATFEKRLAEVGPARGAWLVVVHEVVPALLPGLFAAAGHGLLRTVHAMRALVAEDSPLRRRELARGLAHWSARYQTLPGEPGRAPAARSDGPGAASGSAFVSPRDLDSALDACPTVASPPGASESFVEAAHRLERAPEFRAAVEAVGIPAGPGVDGFLAALCRAAAGHYVGRPDARLAYAHAVTIPAAVRWLAGRLPAPVARDAAFFAFQASAALHALYRGAPVSSAVDPEVAKTAESWDEIRYRAACSLDEHAIKLAEACFREDRDHPDLALRLAAADAALNLDGGRGAARC